MHWITEQRILVVIRELGEATTREVYDKLDKQSQKEITKASNIARVLKKNGYLDKRISNSFGSNVIWFKPRITGKEATKTIKTKPKKE